MDAKQRQTIETFSAQCDAAGLRILAAAGRLTLALDRVNVAQFSAGLASGLIGAALLAIVT